MVMGRETKTNWGKNGLHNNSTMLQLDSASVTTPNPRAKSSHGRNLSIGRS